MDKEKWYQKAYKLIGVVTAFITLLSTLGFVFNTYTGIMIFAVSIWFSLLIGLIYIFLAKKKQNEKIILTKTTKEEYLYTKRFRHFAYWGIAFLLLSGTLSFLIHPVRVVAKYALMPEPPIEFPQFTNCLLVKDTAKVIVANINEDNDFGLTEILINNLQHDAKIIPINRTITEQQGSQYARKIGEDCKADLVIWGWINTSLDEALVVFHLESFIYMEDEPLDNLYKTIVSIDQFQSYDFRYRLTDELKTLIFFIQGVMFSINENYAGAVDSLSKSIEANDGLESILDIADLYRIRGDFNYLLGKYDDAIVDYTNAIAINNNYEWAFINRGVIFLCIKADYNVAISDFQEAIKINPNNPHPYCSIGYAYYSLGDVNKAREFVQKSVELDIDGLYPKCKSLLETTLGTQ